jgi:hypothetical protein
MLNDIFYQPTIALDPLQTCTLYQPISMGWFEAYAYAFTVAATYVSDNY